MRTKITLKQSSIGFAILIWVIVLAVAAFIAQAARAEGNVASTANLESDSGLPPQVIAILEGYYSDAAERIKEIVLHPPGGKQTTREFQQAHAAIRVAQIERIRQQLGARTGLWVGAHMPKAYGDGLSLGQQLAIDAGVVEKGSAFAGTFDAVDRHSLIVLAQDTLADLNRATGSMTYRGQQVLRRMALEGVSEADVNKIIARGIIEGKPLQIQRELTAAIRAVHGDRVTITDKNGDPMEFEADYYAGMVARSKSRAAMLKGQHNRLQSVGIDHVMVIGGISENFCTAFVGGVFSISGKDPDYPPLASIPGSRGNGVAPPCHPHCSKGTRPFVPALATAEQLHRAVLLPDARKLLGKDAATAQRIYKSLQLRQQVVAAAGQGRKRSA